MNELEELADVVEPHNSMNHDKATSESGSRTAELEEQLAELGIGENDPVAIDIHYCNPDAKIVLISRDRVALRADAWLMSRQR